MRRVIAALIVAGLAVGVLVLWPRPVAEENVDPEALGSTTTTSAVVTTTTTTGTTSTTGEGSHVVETVKEAEEILRELWFGWFEGIYNQDEDRIRQVVGTQALLDAALAQFGVMEFSAQPTPSALSFDETEILLATEDCTAIWSNVDATDLTGASNDGVHVFLKRDDEWVLISQWAYREDLWEADCKSQLLP